MGFNGKEEMLSKEALGVEEGLLVASKWGLLTRALHVYILN